MTDEEIYDMALAAVLAGLLGQVGQETVVRLTSSVMDALSDARASAYGQGYADGVDNVMMSNPPQPYPDYPNYGSGSPDIIDWSEVKGPRSADAIGSERAEERYNRDSGDECACAACTTRFELDETTRFIRDHY